MPLEDLTKQEFTQIVRTLADKSGNTAEFLKEISIDSGIKDEITQDLMLHFFTDPSSYQRGIELLDLMKDQEGVVDRKRIVEIAYGKLETAYTRVLEESKYNPRKETITNLKTVIELVDQSDSLLEKSPPTDLDQVWYHPKKQKIEYRETRPHKKAKNFGEILREKIIKDLGSCGKSYGTVQDIIEFFEMTKKHLKINPQDIINAGYNRILTRYGEPDDAVHIIRIGQKLGGNVPDNLLHVFETYQKHQQKS